MSDTQTLIDSYAELASDRNLKGREPDIVADALSTLTDSDHCVVVLEEWLIDDKDIEPVPGAARVFAGEIDAETDKAILLDQGQQSDWLPLSCCEVYQTDPGVTIDTPQAGLSEYDVTDETVSPREVGQ